MPKGVLPMQELRSLLAEPFITGVDPRYVNPASIDLPLSSEAYRLRTIVNLLPGETVRSVLPIIGAEPHDLSQPLETGVPYLIRVEGSWRLPPLAYGYANPKSSTGRLNLFCRVIADKVRMYDALTPPGFQGEVWILVRPDSFPVKLSPGIALSQVRLFDGPSFLDEYELSKACEQHGLLFHQEGTKVLWSNTHRHEHSFLLSLYVGKDMGYQCQPGTTSVLDMSKIGVHEVDSFFEPVRPKNGGMVLKKNTFYILSTDERVLVPPWLSAELRPIDPRLGEFRSHAAGYIDPGWGWGGGRGCGQRITLEVIPYEDMYVRAGQTIARLRYEHMKDVPEIDYEQASSNYTNQEGARLAKFFKL